ncbi:tetratricopeptide repeat protein [Pseudobacillus badius]|uniref:tetratricopeptide repeat protein n=1 Tax=Bacillus badius TaxID=1455 RepID=UPI003CED7E52
MKRIETKLRMPACAPAIQRRRLFSELDTQKQLSLISVIGDGGYGKTTFVASYIHKQQHPAVWYNLTGSDRYSHVFISYLKAGIMEKTANKRLSSMASPEDAEEELEELLSLLAVQKERLYIVLDDYQLVNQSPEIQSIMKQLLDYSSPFVTFIIISRVRPHLSVSRLKTEGKYREFTTADIAFTFSEIKEFFHSLHQLKLEAHELDLIYKKTEGWVASCQLILGIIDKMTVEERTRFWTDFPHVQDIYDYLSSEVFEAQPEEIREFLCQTSLLPELDPEVIDQLLGREDATLVLERLQREQLFITSDSGGMLRYHRLFRQFLYQKYKERVSVHLLQEQQLKLSSIYEARYQFLYAFVYAVVGKDYPAAVRLMEMISHRYNPIESMVFLDGWLEEMTLEENFANNTLFLIRCVPRSIIKQLTSEFEKNISLLKEKNSKLWLCSLQHRLATISLMNGELEKAKQLFLDSLRGAQRFQDMSMTALNFNLLAEIERYFGRHEEAVQHVKNSLFISEKYGQKHTQLHALDTLATICLDNQQLGEAEVHIQQALAIARQHDCSSLFFIYTTMGRLFRLKGQIDRSIQWGERAAAVAEEYNIDFDMGWSYSELGISYMEKRQWQKAESCLAKAYSAFQLFAYYRSKVIKSQIELYRRKQDQLQEKKKLEEFVQVCKEHHFYWEASSLESAENDTAKGEGKALLHIQALGAFQVFRKGEPVVIKRKASLRLLQFFITHRNKKIEKDILLDFLFPEGALEAVQNQFHVAISTLRKALEPDLQAGARSRFIRRTDQHYIFHPAEIDLDIEKFERLAIAGGEGDSPEKIQKLLAAEALYKGDYLEEYPYEPALEPDKERIRTLFLKVCRLLAFYYEQAGEYEKCFACFDKLISKDPYQEEVYFAYIKALLKKDREIEANRIVRQLTIHMEEEMGVNIKERVNQLFAAFNRSPLFIRN